MQICQLILGSIIGIIFLYDRKLVILWRTRLHWLPHNQWLEIFVRFGLLGLPLFFISIFLFIRLGMDTLFQRIRPDIEYSIVTVLFVFGYLQSMTSLTLLNRVLWLGLAMCLVDFLLGVQETSDI